MNCNRLILIGNGFDLALNLKSSYKDFIYYLLKEELIKCLNNNSINNSQIVSENNLFKISRPSNLSNVQEIIQDIQNAEIDNNTVSKLRKFDFTFKFKNNILAKVFNELTVNNWVDIENLYFHELYRLYKGENRNDSHKLIKKLNNEMDDLMQKLIVFLRKQQASFRLNSTSLPLRKVYNQMFKSDVSIFQGLNVNYPIDKIYFLNFNYTDLLSKYLSCHMQFKEHCPINYIHGSIDDVNNPIIFGYGNDTDEIYLELEKDGNDELLKMMKSFHYLKTHNNLNLINFLDSSPFEVLVVGHSCGKSDSTLLKSIFENRNCVAIKLFHYKKLDDFMQKSMAVARHFSDKQKMRQLLLPYDENLSF